ncbi:50S ribosomal protein L15 [Arthrobacter burdickii]|jgi:large subunit ribosomal protein L15|uniref:Large ribosomal subunit protein uL15 n=1 Tax=Arthrobacter burdickii TaxID=3035920 RepID=A0ABT8JZZ4_9MICC|nr:50S ribosomal protein L15 [Arthrobacter burdickii]MDN4610746.1 50S ribosomal protein L15 [Arthrobacter burdickii]
MAENNTAASAAPEAKAERVHALKVHHLRPAPGAKTAKTRVGRGEGSKGKTAGRGTKGTAARYQVKAGFAGGQLPLHMRLPKLRGFKNPFRVEFQVVNLDKLSELYPAGGDVTVDSLVANGAVRKNQPVKVLGTGEITVAVNVSADAFSASAAEKIVAAGGTVTEL